MDDMYREIILEHYKHPHNAGTLDAPDISHEEHNPLRNEEQIQAFFEANGVAADAFNTAWNAEAVTAAVEQARQRTADYGVDKLPAMILNGRYKLVHNAKVFNHVELNIAVNNVIRKLREERRSAI